MFIINCLIIIFTKFSPDPSCPRFLLTRQQNIASRHPRLSGIGRRNKLNLKKDSGQAGMTELGYLLAGVIVGHSFPDKLDSHLRGNDVLKVQTIMGQLLRQEIEKLSHHLFIHAV